MRYHYLFTALMIFLPSLAFATDAEYEKAMARGQALLESRDYASAGQEFRAALAERPDDPSASLGVGASLSRSGNPDAATVLKQTLRLDPANPFVNLELGNHYLGQGVYNEARDYFEETLRLAPDSDAAVLARRGIELINKQGAGKKWGARLMTGLQYDSNVTLSPDGNLPSTGIKHKDDWRGIVNLGLSWTPVKTGTTEIGAGYSFYQSAHINLDKFNLTQNQASLSSSYMLSSSSRLALGYSFDYLMMGGNDYAVTHNVTPSFEKSFGENMLTTLAYRYSNTSFKDGPLFINNHERSGDTHQLSITQKAGLTDKLSVRLSYSYAVENAAKSWWSNDAHQLSGGITAALPWNLVADLSAGATFRKYDDPSEAGPARDDKTWAGLLSLSRQFSSYCSLVAAWNTTHNQSNISLYEYTRSIVSLLGQVRF